MKVLLDTDVILDVLLQREPHVAQCAAVWAAIEEGYAEGAVAAHAITTIHYIVGRSVGANRASEIVMLILKVLSIAGVSSSVISTSVRLDWPDFQDAITASAALEAGCDLIVTRDIAGFSRSPIKAMTPRAALAAMKRSPEGRKRP